MITSRLALLIPAILASLFTLSSALQAELSRDFIRDVLNRDSQVLNNILQSELERTSGSSMQIQLDFNSFEIVPQDEFNTVKVKIDGVFEKSQKFIFILSL